MQQILNAIGLFLLLFSSSLSAAENPEALAKHYVQALEEKDIALFESLIWDIAKLKEREPEMHQKRIAHFLSRKKLSELASYEVVITDIRENRWYDPETQRLAVLDKFAVFPVTPQKQLTIRVTEGDSDSTGGRWTYDADTQAIVSIDGEWFLLFPERWESK